MMTATLHRRGLYRPGPRAVFRLTRILAASVALGVLAFLAAHFRGVVEGLIGGVHIGPLHAKEMAVLGSSVAVMAAYPALLFLSGGLTLAEARGALRRRKGDAGSDAAGGPDLS
jgi:putative peptidoglycan lipid II flippase